MDRRARRAPPGLELTTWRDLPDLLTGIPAGQRPGRLASALRGAIVLPDKYRGRRWIGCVAAVEAEAFLEAGKPALVYAGGKLTAWPDCRLDRRRQAALRFTPYEVLVPDPPPRPLPTLDTSLRALGYAPAARPVRPPRFTPPDLNGTPEVRSRLSPGPGRGG